jgi:hypothetical protein
VVTVTGQKPTKATDLVLFPSKKKTFYVRCFESTGEKKEDKETKSGADHHIVSHTTESRQKRQMSNQLHPKQTFLCTIISKRRKKEKKERNKKADPIIT